MQIGEGIVNMDAIVIMSSHIHATWIFSFNDADYSIMGKHFACQFELFQR